MASELRILVIVASTRPGRVGPKVADWILAQVPRLNLVMERVDLLDYPLPFYEEIEPAIELKGNYKSELAKIWAKKLSTADGFIIVTPEYNHGYPAALKNAIDYTYDELSRKPVALVSYSNGMIGGARVVEALRPVINYMGAMPIPVAVHIPKVTPKPTGLKDRNDKYNLP